MPLPLWLDLKASVRLIAFSHCTGVIIGDTEVEGLIVGLLGVTVDSLELLPVKI